MFAPGGMRESIDKEVTLKDIDVTTMENMLRFMYGASVDLAYLETNILDISFLFSFLLFYYLVVPLFLFYLLGAADMYDITALRLLCEKHITSSLAVHNAAESLHHADRYRLPRLKDTCIKFIAANYLKVINTEGYKTVLRTNCELIIEINQGYSNFRQ
eukprot:TRINITY_DN8981_c0_g2_i2.p2 TRINITY_DN8981_c0_g2~~TRINITY_DN8981_c0_g2_i2.p2  ORF type:complete len:159 (+),score=26.03 TRINITY_DN8981_c0_g2_i2:680-1156(+)